MEDVDVIRRRYHVYGRVQGVGFRYTVVQAANALGLTDISVLENGMRLGAAAQTTLSAFAEFAQRALGGPIRRYGDPAHAVRRVAVLGGAGEDYIPQAIAAGADVYLTGEVAYHKAADAVENGLCVLEAGHAATEHPAISSLAEGLQIAADAVEYNIRVLNSEIGLFC